MKRTVTFAMLIALGVSAAYADSDPIAARKALMKSNGAATKTIVGMLKCAPYYLAAVQSALKSYADYAAAAPALFPDSSKTGDTHALPAIWDNKADFEARFKKFGADASAAMAAVTDEASFKANVPGVLKNCGSCHETYRASMN